MTITGNTNTAPYDGKAHIVKGYTLVANPSFYTEKDLTFSGVAEATRTDAGTANMGLTAAQFVNASNNFKNVTFNVKDGCQTVEPIDATVLISGNTLTAPYDGKAHTVSGYTAQASSRLYDVTKDFTFSGVAEATRTDAGTMLMRLRPNQFANTNKNFRNVTFNVRNGFVNVNPIDGVEVTIRGNSGTAPYDGKAHTVSGYTAETSSPLYDVTKDFTFSGVAEAAQTDAGTAAMGLNAAQFANASGNFKNVTFNVTDGYQTVEPIDGVVVTITGNANTAPYDGKAHTVSGYTAEASSHLYDVTKDFTFSGVAEAAQTDAGTAAMGLNAAQFANASNNFKNVTFNVKDGYQTVEPIDGVVVTITGNANTAPYDGKAHTVKGYTFVASPSSYTEKDFTFSGVAEAAQTDAGTAAMGLNAAQFANASGNFKNVTFNVTDGYQTVEPIDGVVVTITGNANTAPYDGEIHTVTGYTAIASTDLYDVTKDFTFSGVAKAVRIDAGTTYMGLKAEQFENKNTTNFRNVTFVVKDGYQTVEPIDVVVTITSNTDTVPYDGERHTISGYTAKASNPLYDVMEGFTFIGTAEAVRIDAGTTTMGLRAFLFSNTNPNFTNVTFDVTDGYLTVERLTGVVVNIRGNTKTVYFDKTEHTVEGYTVEASNPLYMSTDFSFSGKAEARRTSVGKTQMQMDEDDFENVNSNFEDVVFDVENGWIEVMPSPVNENYGLKIEIVGENTVYNGSHIQPQLRLIVNGTRKRLNGAARANDIVVIPASEYTVTYKNNINAGTAKVIITDNPGGNYIVNGEATFTIEKRPATITAADQTVEAGGRIKTGVKQVKASGLLKGHTLKSVKLTSSSTAKATARGTITPGGAMIVDAKGRDVTKNYDISYAKGKLTVKGNPRPAKPDYTLLAQIRACGSKSLRVTWTKVEGAGGYDVYFVKNDRGFGKAKVASVTGALTCKFTGLEKKTAYKAYVQAWKYNEYGRKINIGKASPTVCAITGNSDKKWTNAASVKVKATELSLKVGKKTTIKADLKGVKSGRKVKLQDCKLLRYYSANRNVATVSASGKVKAVGKGTCTIWVVAANGLRTAVKVKVK